jgi:hypothetical protein
MHEHTSNHTLCDSHILQIKPLSTIILFVLDVEFTIATFYCEFSIRVFALQVIKQIKALYIYRSIVVTK